MVRPWRFRATHAVTSASLSFGGTSTWKLPLGVRADGFVVHAPNCEARQAGLNLGADGLRVLHVVPRNKYVCEQAGECVCERM